MDGGLGRHPADIAGQADEYRRVKALRDRNMPWPHVARQLGRPEPALRQAYDPTFHWPGELRRVEVASAPPKAGKTSDRILAFLAHEGALRVADLAERVLRSPPAVSASLGTLFERGFVASTNGGGKTGFLWTITDAGRERLQPSTTERTRCDHSPTS